MIRSIGFSCRHAGALAVVALVIVGAASLAGQSAGDGAALPGPVPAALTGAPRPSLPADVTQIWLVPGRAASAPVAKAAANLVAGLRLFAQAKYADAQPLLGRAADGDTPLAAYATFYGGLCSLNLSRPAEARTAFARLHASNPPGYLSEAAIVREAEASSAQGDHAAAARLYDELTGRNTANPDAILMALGKEYEATGDRQRAADAFARLYYGYPLSDLATVAATELDGLKDVDSPGDAKARFDRDLGRAERLFGTRRYTAARLAFTALAPLASGDGAEIVALRIAECDHFLRRHREAREQLAPYLDGASREAEARFFSLTAARELGQVDEYVNLARALVTEFPASSWADDTLNNLATHYILADDDESADTAFRELYAKFPQGPHAERAAWRAGWWAYKRGQYQETIRYFEGASATFARSDYRPAYLYWSARSREQLGDRQGSAAVYRTVASDYLGSYYGRLALKRLPASTVRTISATPPTAAQPAVPGLPPTADVIRSLLSLGLYDQAREELLYAQRVWGESPVVGATLAWVFNKQGDYRKGIVQMKRAYPQYLSAEGARLPSEALEVIFPLDHWALIRKYSAARGLDPYLVAALINQESAFDADIKSAANAIGLMQVLPSTGRRYARLLRIRRYSTAALTRPETNIQIGTAYFAELIRRSGGIHHALASYNAGESRVRRWNAERPGLEVDEYIDDIPFPETQAYVKKILGTAEDYRRLYSTDAGASERPALKPAAPPKAKPSPAQKKKR